MKNAIFATMIITMMFTSCMSVSSSKTPTKDSTITKVDSTNHTDSASVSTHSVTVNDSVKH
jgi:hypothetical protein